MELLSATIEGASPDTVDPAWCYDTASAELIFNVYETLITFDGEHADMYVPQLATEWTIEDITGTTSPEGLPWYFRYTFTIREGVTFHCGSPYILTPEDVEYSIERGMVQDRDGGPQWMFYEPLLNTWGANGLGDIGNCTHPRPDVALVGQMIDHAVESNSTHVWFNFAFPGAYAPFLQILSQTCASIMSKAWVVNDVIGTLGRPDWNGEWGDYTGWICFHNPEVSPLDDPDPILCGTGPFSLVILDYVEMYWQIARFVDYWRGWPADWPAPPYPSDPTKNITPAGYVDTAKVTWKYGWFTRRDMFLAGDVDFCAVPREYLSQVIDQPGIRCTYPLATLSVSNLFYTFDIDPATIYGNILDYGVIQEDGIPRDFFGNPTWGINVSLDQAFLGQAIAAATAIIPGLICYDPTVAGYYYDLAKAEAEFKAVPGLWDTGFTITVMYNSGNLARQRGCEMIETQVEAMNAKFHVEFFAVDWGSYLVAMINRQLPMFINGWLADYPDPHNFAYPFYHTYGAFSQFQGYSNPTMDALIDLGIRTGNPAARCAIYHDVQVLAVDDCPSVPLAQAIGRHFERDWVAGWYYNPISPGIYFYNLWKWYYIPHSTYEAWPEYPICNHLPYDVNYDGTINILDLYAVCNAYGTSYGPPIHPRWHFRCDVTNDRIINIPDLGWIAIYYGEGVPTEPVHGGDVYLVAEPSKEIVSIGYNVSVAVKIKNVTDIAGYEIRLRYNASLLELVDWNIEPLLGWYDTYSVEKPIGDTMCIALTGLGPTAPFSGDATLVTFILRGLGRGNATIDISKSILAAVAVQIPYNPVNGEVRVTIAGDINGDDIVDMTDLGWIAYSYGATPSDPKWNANRDITDDGIIDMTDLGIAAMHYGETYP